MNHEEQNKIIAEWMGLKIGIDTYSWRPGVTDPLTVEHLAYHSSFDWLIPVAKKLKEELIFRSEWEASDCLDNLCSMAMEFDISQLYNVVFEGIEYLNKHKV